MKTPLAGVANGSPTDEQLYRRIVEAAEEGIITMNAQAVVDFVNPKMALMLGYRADEILGRSPTDFMDEDGRQSFAYYLGRRQQGITEHYDFKFYSKQGRELWVNISANPLLDVNGHYVGTLALLTDISERREAQELLAWEKSALETIGSGTSLLEVLHELVLGLERHLPGAICSLLLVDEEGQHLLHGAAPSLPTSYIRAIDGVAIGAAAGSCGTAAYTRRQVIVSDIGSDPLWLEFRDLALENGLQACWSTPVLDNKAKVIATFAVYHRQPRLPNPKELRTMERAVHIACLAIERKRADEMLAASQVALHLANERLRLSNEKLERRVDTRTQQLRALATELTHAEERERLRMADTMHEGLLQLLTAIALRLESLRKHLAPRTDGLDEAQSMVEEAIKVGKTVICELYPPAIHTLGLGEALRWLGQRYSTQGLEVEVEAPPNFDVPEKELRITLFRAANELLINVRRHARVEQAKVAIALTSNGIVRMLVSDSGVGFSPADIRAQEGLEGGFGLFSLRERIEALGGRVEIESEPGRGSRFTVTVPTVTNHNTK